MIPVFRFYECADEDGKQGKKLLLCGSGEDMRRRMGLGSVDRIRSQ